MTNDPYKQTLYVVWINQVLFLVYSLLLGWNCLPLAVLSMFIFGCISEISIHRYFTHKSYTTTPFKEKILILFALLSGQGAIMSWVTTHRIHHANADTPYDAHSPLFNPWWKIMLGLFPRKNIKYSLNLIRDLMRSPNWKYYVFENSYYWLMWTAIWVVSLCECVCLCVCGQRESYMLSLFVCICLCCYCMSTSVYVCKYVPLVLRVCLCVC